MLIKQKSRDGFSRLFIFAQTSCFPNDAAARRRRADCPAGRDLSASHKTAAADFRKPGESQRPIKGRCPGRVVRCQLDLPNIGISVENGFQQSRSDALTLLIRKYKKILNKDNGKPIPDNSDDSQQFFIFVSRQYEQRVFESLLQCRHVLRVCRPSDFGIKTQNFVFPVFPIFSDFHFALTNADRCL